MEKGGVSIVVESDGRRHAGTSPFRIPNPALRIGLVDVDGRIELIAIEVGHLVRLQVDLDVIKVVLPLIAGRPVVSRIVESVGIVGLVVVVCHKRHVKKAAVPAGQYSVVRRPFEPALDIHIGHIPGGPGPRLSVVVCYAVCP